MYKIIGQKHTCKKCGWFCRRGSERVEGSRLKVKGKSLGRCRQSGEFILKYLDVTSLIATWNSLLLDFPFSLSVPVCSLMLIELTVIFGESDVERRFFPPPVNPFKLPASTYLQFVVQCRNLGGFFFFYLFLFSCVSSNFFFINFFAVCVLFAVRSTGARLVPIWIITLPIQQHLLTV